MSLLLDGRVGMEDLQVQVYSIAQEQINAYVAAEETYGQALDTKLATYDDYMREVGPVTVERFDPRNIHNGHRPSMIEAPIDEYPSMSVMTMITMPNPVNSNADYGHSLSIRMAIEAIVKSGPYREDRPDVDKIGEDIVGRRIKRTAEAIFKMMDENRAVGGLFLPPDLPPTITIGDIFVRQEDGPSGTGSRWYWQGVRIEWLFAKQTVANIDQY